MISANFYFFLNIFFFNFSTFFERPDRPRSAEKYSWCVCISIYSCYTSHRLFKHIFKVFMPNSVCIQLYIYLIHKTVSNNNWKKNYFLPCWLSTHILHWYNTLTHIYFIIHIVIYQIFFKYPHQAFRWLLFYRTFFFDKKMFQ